MLEKLQNLSQNSQSNYYHYPVAAIIECTDGTLFEGVNVETSSPGSGVCAERNALFSALSKGYKKSDFKKIHIYNKSQKTITPCFVCRQALVDYCNMDIEIISYTNTEYKIYKLKDLCPETFDKTDLEKIGDNL